MSRFDPTRVQALRAERHLSRRALSALTDLTENTVLRVELGYTSPRASTLAQLADAFGVTVADLFTDEVSA